MTQKQNSPQVILKAWQNQEPEMPEDTIEELIDWIESEWDSKLTPENEKERIKMIVEVIRQFSNSKYDMKVIELQEKYKLEMWTKSTKSVKGE